MKTDDYLYGCSKEAFLSSDDLAHLDLLRVKLVQRLKDKLKSVVHSDQAYTSHGLSRQKAIADAITFWDTV